MSKQITTQLMALLFSIGLITSTAYAEQSGPEDTTLQFFEASRNGDVTQMLELISGSYYNRRKAVLESNDNYPAFLMEHYQGTTTTIEKSDIDKKNQVAVVIARTRFPDQSLNTARLLLKKDNNGKWKIVDEK